MTEFWATIERSVVSVATAAGRAEVRVDGQRVLVALSSGSTLRLPRDPAVGSIADLVDWVRSTVDAAPAT